MRPFLALVTGLVLMQASVSKADFDQDLDESDYVTESELADVVATAGWNRWTCTAHGTAHHRLFRGASYYFRAGSGEGQEAKRVAQKIAVRACEFANAGICTSNLAACKVEKH